MFSSLTAKLLLGAAVLIAIVGVIFTIYEKGETAGSTEVTAKVLERTKQVQGKITDAESLGPRTPSDVSKLLRAGTF